MRLGSLLGWSATAAACLGLAFSCSDDDGEDGNPGAGGSGIGGSAAAGRGGSGMGGGGTIDASTLSFAADISPLLQNYCFSCHSGEFASMDEAAGYQAVLTNASSGDPFYEEIVKKIASGEMPFLQCNGAPPGSPGCVSIPDFAKIKGWAEFKVPPAP